MQSQPSAKRKNSKRLRRWMQTKSGRRDDRNGCVKRIKIVPILKSSKMCRIKPSLPLSVHDVKSIDF